LSCEASRSPAPSRASESARQPNNPERNDRERSGKPQLQQCVTHALLRGCVVITSLCPMVGVVCVSVLRHVHGDQPTIRQHSRHTLTSIQFRTIQQVACWVDCAGSIGEIALACTEQPSSGWRWPILQHTPSMSEHAHSPAATRPALPWASTAHLLPSAPRLSRPQASLCPPANGLAAPARPPLSCNEPLMLHRE